MKKLIFLALIGAGVVLYGYNRMTEKTIGFDYDSTISFSTPTFLAEQVEDPQPRLAWELINGRLLDLEKKKRVAGFISLARFFGYTPIVITARPEIRGDLFRAHASRSYGVKPEDIYMTKEKATVLRDRHTVIFFGDSDGDITEAQKAGVFAVRVTRSQDDQYKDNYNPGRFGEFILPFSSAHD
jgi:acid phosphatase (class B)